MNDFFYFCQIVCSAEAVTSTVNEIVPVSEGTKSLFASTTYITGLKNYRKEHKYEMRCIFVL